jgi:Cu+-exporting ATPase
VEGREVLVVMLAWLQEHGINFDPPWHDEAGRWQQSGRTVAGVVVDGNVVALLGFEDPPKASTAEAVRELRRLGLRLVMVTGDAEATARTLAGTLGLDEVHAGIEPAAKQTIVRGLQAEGRCVAFAGDGLNDAPALAAAEVGIAMGTGADVAIESAGLVLVEGDLAALVRAVHLSRAVMRNIKQNLFLAFVYNSVGIPIAAGALVPAFGWTLNPMLAGVAMSLSSLSVVSNALRLRSVKL